MSRRRHPVIFREDTKVLLDNSLNVLEGDFGVVGTAYPYALYWFCGNTWINITAITSGTTLASYGITDAAPLIHNHAYQPLSDNLTNIVGLSGTGYLKKTGTNTYILDNTNYLTGITSAQVTGALGFTPYNSSNPAGYLSSITKAQVEAVLTGEINSHIHTNYLTGITSAQVTTALGFTPYNSSNPAGYLSSITKAQVEAVLTGAISSHTHSYQPLNTDLSSIANLGGTSGYLKKTSSGTWSLDTSTYLTSITKLQVEAVLGFTPYNSSNPAGYITSASIPTSLPASDVYAWAKASVKPSYSITEITGKPTTLEGWGITNFKSSNSSNPIAADSALTNGHYYGTSLNLFAQTDGALYVQSYDSTWAHQIYGDYRSGQIATRGRNSSVWGPWRTVIDSVSIGFQSVNFANSATNADTVDGHHFNWSGQGGQPTWLWGGNDSANMYVYNPSNFSVNYANTAGSTNAISGLSVHGGRNNEANKVVRTDSSGYLQCGYINSESGNEGNNSSPARIWGTNGSDNYLRTYLTSALVIPYANLSGRPTVHCQTSQPTGSVDGDIWIIQ